MFSKLKKPFGFPLFRSLAFKYVFLFGAMMVGVVLPIAVTYLNTVETLLTEKLAAELAVVAQRGSTMVDAAAVMGITGPSARGTPPFRALVATLARIQREFEVDNAVVIRRTTTGGYAYVADGNGYFAINEHVDLHDRFPKTKPPADEALETGRLGATGLFSSGDTKWFQINAPLLEQGEVVGLLLINKFATPVAVEIQRRQRQIVLGVAVVLLVGIGLWGFVATRMVRPLVTLRRAAARISAGDLEVTIPSLKAGDEVGDLNRAFFQMVDDLKAGKSQIDAYTKLLQNEKDSFSRFVPTQFLELLGRDSALAIQLGDNSPRTMSVMFSDIRGFTALSEAMDAGNVFSFLNEYLARLEPPIQKHGGFVDKFLGDGIMALFQDDPAAGVTSADCAVAAATEMRGELAIYNHLRMEQGLGSIRVGIGVHTGPLMLGTVGSRQRISTTVVGDTVNLASRIEALTSHYRAGVILSQAAYEALTDPQAHSVREIASVQASGKTQAVKLFDVFDWEPGAMREKKLKTAPAFAKALARYRAGKFADARVAFRRVLQRNPDDRTTRAYGERCEQHLAVPPPNWEGVDVFIEK